MPTDQAGGRPDSGRLTLPFSRTLLSAVLLEGMLLAGAGVLLAHAETPPPPAPPEIIPLAFTDPKVEEVRKPEVKKIVPKPLPKPVPRKIVQPRVQPPPPKPVPQPVKPLPVVNDSPVSVKVPVRPPPPPPPPPPDDTAAKEASFAAALKAAIQAAVVYPPAARMSGFQGEARIEFVFRNGVCSQIRVIRSSGSGLIDRAAMAAVSAAVPPPMPASLAGRSMTYQVTVSFELNAT